MSIAEEYIEAYEQGGVSRFEAIFGVVSNLTTDTAESCLRKLPAELLDRLKQDLASEGRIEIVQIGALPEQLEEDAKRYNEGLDLIRNSGMVL
jgi:hypothetical protein